MEMPTAVPTSSTHQLATHAGSLKTPALPADQQLFCPKPIGRLETLMSKENRTLTLMKIGTEEASTCFDAHTSQDEASYDGNVSDPGDDIKVVPDEVDDTQVKSSKPVGATSATGKEVQKAANKSSGHIKKCASAHPNITIRKVKPGEPHWMRSDLPLMNHTWALETEVTFKLPVWPDPPNDEEAAH